MKLVEEVVSQLVLLGEMCASCLLCAACRDAQRDPALPAPGLCLRHICTCRVLHLPWLPGDLKRIFPCPRGRSWVLISSATWDVTQLLAFFVARVSRVSDAINFSHLFLQYKEGMWNPCGGCSWLDAPSMAVCAFRTQALPFLIPWHSLSLHTPQTIRCVE